MSTKLQILKHLEQGSIRTIPLFKLISNRTKITKQAFYKALRDLLAEEKVTVHGKHVSISAAWIAAQQRQLERIGSSYGIGETSQFVLQAETIRYSFSTLRSLDMFLSHLFIVLLENTVGPVFIYNDHEWFSYGREATNNLLIGKTMKKNRPICITVANTSPLDKALAKPLNKNPLQYYMSETALFPETISYNIFEDHIITFKMDRSICTALNKWFATHPILTPEAIRQMETIVHTKGKHRVTVERNPAKAELLKKKLRKYFVVK